MAKTDLKLNATGTDGKATTATITYVNPEASNSQLATLGRMLNNLTDNTYGTTLRINTIDCETEGGGSKQVPTLSLGTSSVSVATIRASFNQNNGYSIHDITYDGDGQLHAYINNGLNVCGVGLPAHYQQQPNTYSLGFYGHPSVYDYVTAGTVVIRAEETDTYAAAEVIFTVTE